MKAKSKSHASKTAISMVNVTAKDIKEGVPFADSCPITLAVKRLLKVSEVETDDEIRVWGNLDETDKTYKLPKKAINFIKRFDADESVKPFKFRLIKKTIPTIGGICYGD